MGWFRRCSNTISTTVTPPTYACEQICDLLVKTPEDWNADEYWMTHVGGAKIWIANWDIIWSRKCLLPGGAWAVPEHARGSDNAALHEACETALAHIKRRDVDRYVASAAISREERARKNAEEARRADFNAGSLRLAAEREERRAAELRTSK